VGPPEQTYIDHRNTFAARSYALLGVRVGRRKSAGLSWFIDVRNLTDERYAATTGVIENANRADQPQLLPGDRCSVFTGAEWRW
jgi:iron complex outermembrane receptor protein